MYIIMKIALSLSILLSLLSPIIKRKRNRRKKGELGSILLKVETINISIFFTKILIGFGCLTLVYMSVLRYVIDSSNPNFQDPDFSLWMALFWLAFAITLIRDGIVRKYGIEFREKGIYSDSFVIKWVDVNYYYWNKYQIDVKYIKKTLFFTDIFTERFRVNSGDINKIDAVLEQYITKKPHNKINKK